MHNDLSNHCEITYKDTSINNIQIPHQGKSGSIVPFFHRGQIFREILNFFNMLHTASDNRYKHDILIRGQKKITQFLLIL